MIGNQVPLGIRTMPEEWIESTRAFGKLLQVGNTLYRVQLKEIRGKDNDTNESIGILGDMTKNDWMTEHMIQRLKRAVEGHYDGIVTSIDFNDDTTPKYRPVDGTITLDEPLQTVNIRIEKVWEY